MEKINVIIIHGAYGHPEENWFGWLKNELQALGIACSVPQLPTPENQNIEQWMLAFNKACKRIINFQTVFIGHSLGAVFALRWLEKNNVKLFATFLIGTFLGEVGIEKFDSINKDFFKNPFNWQKIYTKSHQFIAYHGDNDPYVKRQDFDFIADQLAAKKIILSNAGHMNTASGYSTFPQLLLHLQQLRDIYHHA